MNSLKKEEGDFLRLLLSTSNVQRRALLNTIKRSQLNAIVQIVYNVLINNRSLPDNDKKILTRHKRIIRRFVNKGITYAERRRILQKYYKHISKFLKVIQSEL